MFLFVQLFFSPWTLSCFYLHKFPLLPFLLGSLGFNLYPSSFWTAETFDVFTIWKVDVTANRANYERQTMWAPIHWIWSFNPWIQNNGGKLSSIAFHFAIHLRCILIRICRSGAVYLSNQSVTRFPFYNWPLFVYVFFFVLFPFSWTFLKKNYINYCSFSFERRTNALNAISTYTNYFEYHLCMIIYLFSGIRTNAQNAYRQSRIAARRYIL